MGLHGDNVVLNSMSMFFAINDHYFEHRAQSGLIPFPCWNWQDIRLIVASVCELGCAYVQLISQQMSIYKKGTV